MSNNINRGRPQHLPHKYKINMKKKECKKEAHRPKKYASPEEMQKVIDGYFKECEDKKDPLTIEGLSLALDIHRRTLLTYEKDETHADFHHTVKRAKAVIQADFVKRALTGDYNPTISIFLLKNNFGYEDRMQHEVRQEKLITGMSREQITEALADEIL